MHGCGPSEGPDAHVPGDRLTRSTFLQSVFSYESLYGSVIRLILPTPEGGGFFRLRMRLVPLR
jgi:hypothetical protein